MGWVMAKAIALSLICVLCLLPALAISTYHWIDKTQHRPIFPDFRKASGFIMKCRLPVFFIVAVLVVPCIIAQGKNDFLYGASRIYSTNATQMDGSPGCGRGVRRIKSGCGHGSKGRNPKGNCHERGI